MERIDDLQRGGLKIIQDTRLFCFGTDAVLLADFVRLKRGLRIADLGCGGGIIPLLLYGRENGIHVSGIEIQSELCGLARRSVELSGADKEIRIYHGDIANSMEILGTGFDIVTSNPPYEKRKSGYESQSASQRLARFEICVNVEQICRCAAGLLKTGGKFYMINRASRFAEIAAALSQNGLEAKELKMIHSKIRKPAERLLLCAKKGAKSGLIVHAPLVLYDEDGNETDELKRIYGGHA